MRGGMTLELWCRKLIARGALSGTAAGRGLRCPDKAEARPALRISASLAPPSAPPQTPKPTAFAFAAVRSSEAADCALLAAAEAALSLPAGPVPCRGDDAPSLQQLGPVPEMLSPKAGL